nr:acylphosphatase [Companilactobacillus zhachilii]
MLVKHLSINVNGLVQGVGFRYSTFQVAQELEVTGTVRNEMDGSVSIEAEADEKILYIFLNRIKSSPSPFGKVNKMDYTFSDDLQHYTKFTVIG